MFTGLIEQVGEIGSWRQEGARRKLTIQHASWGGDGDGLTPGDSVAVDGACLTAEHVATDHFVATVLAETVSRTSLADKGVGARVNLERAMQVGDRFGGHWVQGHVDALGRIQDIRVSDGDRVVRVGCSNEVMGGIVEKGSITLDGISLTVVGIGDAWFEVHIIPHTWEHTALRDLRPGSGINIETDILGKYVRRILESSSHSGSLTLDTLRASGAWLA